jgi:hypothetical protein
VYGVCKVNKDVALRGRVVPFRDIIYHYQKQPQCREDVFWTVILSQSDPVWGLLRTTTRTKIGARLALRVNART